MEKRQTNLLSSYCSNMFSILSFDYYQNQFMRAFRNFHSNYNCNVLGIRINSRILHNGIYVLTVYFHNVLPSIYDQFCWLTLILFEKEVSARDTETAEKKEQKELHEMVVSVWIKLKM